ncbi:hypothetical protein Gotur_020146 [Gossypium turneri]
MYLERVTDSHSLASMASSRPLSKYIYMQPPDEVF